MRLWYVEQHALRFFWVITNLVLGFFFLRTFIVSFGVVEGVSMEPNFHSGKSFIVSKLSYVFQTPKRGDVVQVYEPGMKKVLLKRIVGLPGEVVLFKLNTIYIRMNNDEFPVSEPYISENTVTSTGPLHPTIFTIPANSYFVIGDNRPNSADSRTFGALHRSYILGKVTLLP